VYDLVVLVGLCMQDYKFLCAATLLLDPKLDF